MRFISKRRAIAWLALITFAIVNAAPAFAAMTRLHTFTSVGLYPFAKLTAGPDGNLYGTAQSGGLYGKGSVFKVTPDGTIAAIASFDGTNGSEPTSELVLGSDGYLYGTTMGGTGPTVFKVSTTGLLITLARMDGNDVGVVGAPVLASDGNLYGTICYHPSGNLGSIYKITPTGELSTLVTLPSDGSMGYSPISLFQSIDGNLYGITYGTSANSGGAIFKSTLDGHLSLVAALAAASTVDIQPAVVQDSDGAFIAIGGGGRGTVYRVTADGTTTALGALKAYPHGGLSRTNDGRYCGVTSATPSAAVFCVTGSSAPSTVATFPANVDLNGVTQGSDGNFYALTEGYPGSQLDPGAIYRVSPAGSVSLFASLGFLDGADPNATLLQASDGNFYGTTASGGDDNYGTVFRITPSGDFTKLASFDGTNGSVPIAPLTQSPDGGVYGFTQFGGAYGKGTIFKIAFDGVLTNIASFQDQNVSAQSDPLAVGSDGLLYGTTCQGGANGHGAIFRLATDGTVSTLFSFSGTDGNCANGLSPSPDGTLIGTTVSGGASGTGSIFSISTDGLFTNLPGAGLNGPRGPIQFTADGTEYGAATARGIFRRSPSGTIASFQPSGSDTWTSHGITIGSNGRLYGSSSFSGTVFQVTPAGVYDSVLSVPSVAGPVLQASDGNFYGATKSDGGLGGTIFRIDGPPAAPTNLSASAGDRYAQLTWTAVGAATSYNVYASTTPNDALAPRIASNVTNTIFSATGLNSGVTYYFTVRAIRDGIESSASNEATAATPSPTVTLNISSSSIAQGSSATLTWNSTNATSCAATGAWTGSEATAGTLSVSPSPGTYTYVLGCNGGGPSATASVTLSVLARPTIAFSINPGFITLGDSATFTWSSTNATSCVGTGPWSGALALSASQPVTPSMQGFLTYGITCTGGGGNASASASIKVFPAPLPTISIRTNSGPITLGGSTTIVWTSTGATSCTASEAWIGDRPTSGQEVVTPAVSGTLRYTLGCSGPGGFVTASTVLSVFPTVSFSTGALSVSESTNAVGIFVQLSGPTDADVTVPLTFSGSATSPSDYTGTVSSLTIPKGSTVASTVLNIVDDSHYEPTETVVVAASAPYNATLASPSTETISILDNDLHVSLSPSSANAFVLEQQCVTARAYETSGSSLSGIPLSFSRSGANPGSGAATSASDGTSQQCWTGNAVGTDVESVQSAYASATSTITWKARPTTIAAKGLVSIAPLAGQVTINPNATLRDVRSNTPIAGRTLRFMANKQFLCSGVTGSDGSAKCSASVVGHVQAVLTNGYTAYFDGDAIYQPTTAPGSLICIGANCSLSP